METTAFMIVFALVVMVGIARANRREDRQRAKRHQQRRLRLHRHFIGSAELAELTALVDGIRTTGQVDACDVESLLDRYVDVSIAHQRCLTVLGTTDLSRLAAKRDAAAARGARVARVLDRRIAHLAEAGARARRLEDARAEISYLVRRHAVLGDVPAVDRVLECELVENALGRIDARDALERELQA